MKIIGVIGKNGAGKSTFTKVFIEHFPNSEVLSTGDIFRDVLSILRLEQTRENIIFLAKMLRENFHENIVTNVLREKIIKSKKEYILIDGVRGQRVSNLLKELGQPLFVAITAHKEIRYKRIAKRDGIKKDFRKYFLSLDKVDFSEEIKTLKKDADIVITNNQDKKTFNFKINNALLKLLKIKSDFFQN